MKLKVRKLDELCNIEIGKTPARANKKFWDEDKVTKNIWLSIADLKNIQNNHVYDSKEYLTNEGCDLFNYVKKGTLLFSFKLTIGRMAFAGTDLRTNEAIAALSIKDENELDKFFLMYFLQSIDWNKFTEGDEKVKGKTLNKKKIKNIEISYPSIDEQRNTVKSLDEVLSFNDKAIDITKEKLENLRDLRGAILNQFFKKH